ncbi:MAG: carboxymuconolactone decarboxylase family protein [Spirochaetales bacterium]|nr:carboxymuconolactone decarboxylase family protein [Spirochaetales bacterium]
MAKKNVFQIFSDETPGIVAAWQQMAQATNIDGCLDEKTVLLLKIAVYSAMRDPIALRHFVGLAFKAGISKKEIQSAAMTAAGITVTYGEMAMPLIQEVEEGL